MADVLDLFGYPMRERQGMRGRPAYVPTDEDRNKIKLLLALGKSISIMASAISVSPATVKRYFRAELKVRDAMRHRMEAAYALTLWGQVQQGNVAAMRLWAQFIETNDRMGAEQDMAAAPSADKPTPVGKKVIDQQRAFDADADLTAELEQEAAAGNAGAVH